MKTKKRSHHAKKKLLPAASERLEREWARMALKNRLAWFEENWPKKCAEFAKLKEVADALSAERDDLLHRAGVAMQRDVRKRDLLDQVAASIALRIFRPGLAREINKHLEEWDPVPASEGS